MLTQPEIVDMWRSACLEHRNEFMLAAVEGTHAGGRLHPYTEVLVSQADCLGRHQELRQMPPVHEDVKNCAIERCGSCQFKGPGQELGKPLLAHFAGGLPKLPETAG